MLLLRVFNDMKADKWLINGVMHKFHTPYWIQTSALSMFLWLYDLKFRPNGIFVMPYKVVNSENLKNV